ncbi:VOC family protein [Martelella alba]|uniref:VOC family protein n=1 Tax=Martelella alba TaxID=2590451 RepID=A0ABY2SPU3_9HYPH|nr:VOC family protein [Martelella alba]TKI07258.1 VOC family protein [Martelella alba]
MKEIGGNGQIDYVEFNVSDLARTKAFYGEVFGWIFTDYGPTYTEFSDGRITGGFTTTETITPHGGPLVIFYAENLHQTLQKLQAAGAEIVKPVFAFPGGQRFHFKDPDGYVLGVWTED